MDFYRETARQEGFKYPAFLDGDYTVSYQVDVLSLFKYYVGEGIFSLAGLEKMTGINQKQLWSYLNGTKPRKAQVIRMEKGFQAIWKDLDMIFG